MSEQTFSMRCKLEIADSAMELRECCLDAYVYGMVCFARRFGSDGLVLASKHAQVADIMFDALVRYGVPENGIDRQSNASESRLLITEKNEIDRLLMGFGYLGDEPSLRLRTENFLCPDCVKSFLAGAFIAGGTVTDPGINYHLEFIVNRARFCADLSALLESTEYAPKLVRRGYARVLYYKDSTAIEELLAMMGACVCSMELMQTKIVKDIRNSANRRANCDNANIDKALAASEAVRRDIEYLKEFHPSALDGELLAVADLRCEYAELSLSELGALCSPALSKSAVNRRMDRIRETAKQKREQDVGN